jgi:hypothetical protein
MIVIGALVLFCGYIATWLVVDGFMWLGMAATLVVLFATGLAGVVLAVVTFVRTLAGTQATRPVTVTPVRARALLPKRRGNPPFPRDLAWPGYVVAQWRVDLATAHEGVTDVLAAGFGRISRYASGPDLRWLRIVCTILAQVCWLTFSAGAMGATWAMLALCWVVRTVAWLAWLALGAALRGGDLLIRRMRRAEASCPQCYHVNRLPAFRCEGCGAVHHDIRPGRLGAMRRRCSCGAHLATTVLGASAQRLTANCQNCQTPLRPGSAVLTDIRVPLFGPVFAGKTRLMYAGLVALRDAAVARGAHMDFVDDDSRQAVQSGSRIISSGGDTVKTPAGVLPSALTVKFTLGRRKALVHLFDAAGEFYGDRQDNSDLEFLDHAQGLVLVIDPFSLPWVRDQLGQTYPVDLVRASTAAQEPEAVYQTTARRLRDYRVRTEQRALAVTVVKADLLAGLPPAADLHPDRVRSWLLDAGMDNLVTCAERDFGDVRYFLVASVSAGQAGPGRSPAAPLHWLVSRAGLPLLPEETRPVSTEGAV